MTAKKRATQNTLGETDLRRIDKHAIQPHEYKEAPELTDKQLDRGRLEIGGKPVRRGRPPLARRKAHVSLRLDPEVLAYFKRQGRGWQARINETLLRTVKRARR